MDTVSKEKRSWMMSRVRGKNTQPELELRTRLWRIGLRYKIHYQLPGHPDIVFPREKVAIFVDGCFWHGCPRCYRAPKTHYKYWSEKIAANKQRDIRQRAELKRKGWTVLKIWGHDIKKNLDKTAARIERKILKARQN